MIRFSVFDVETGNQVDAADVADHPVHSGVFAVTADGDLIAVTYDSWQDLQMDFVPKEGKYLVQTVDGSTVSTERW